MSRSTNTTHEKAAHAGKTTPRVPPGYKPTEVGVIPEDWEVCPVRQKGEVITGKALAANGLGPQRPYLRTKNVFDGRIEVVDVLTMPMTDEQFAQFRIRAGDVLLNEGQSLELVGRCAIYRDEYPEPCAIQNALLRFRARSSVSGEFASYLFRRCQHTGVFSQIALQTTSIAHLGGSRLERLPLAWPPTLAEQEAIATALRDADSLIDSLEQLIAKKRLLKQGAMQDLLTGKKRLPGFEGEWEVKKLGEVVGIRNERINPQAGQHSKFCIELEHLDQGSGILIGHTKTSETSSLKCVFQKGDVLFGKLRSYLRKHWYATQDGVCSTEIWVMKPSGSEIETPYLYQVVQTDIFVDATSLSFGTHMPRSDWKVVRELELVLPPTLEQTAIAVILSDMDAEIDALEAKLAKARQVKQGMMQELLTGKTRLVAYPQKGGRT